MTSRRALPGRSGRRHRQPYKTWWCRSTPGLWPKLMRRKVTPAAAKKLEEAIRDVSPDVAKQIVKQSPAAVQSALAEQRAGAVAQTYEK